MKSQWHIRQGSFRPLMLLILSWLTAFPSRPVHGAAFTNATPITFPAGAPAAPYPSPISVSQITGAVVNVSVTLNSISHVFPDDLDVLLVGPGGNKVMLMSDAGGGNSVSGLNLTFSASNSASLPDSGAILSGSYRPTDYQMGDVLPAPAPAGPHGTDLTIFNGINPNGTWQLLAYDDATFNGGGSIAGGWRLVIDVASPPVITTHPQSQTVAPGSTVSFTVVVTGTPPLGFQWLRNGQVLVPFGSGGPSLTITNVQAANAGTYAVVVTNSASPASLASSNAVLNVLGPLTLVESPQDQSAGPGETVKFQVTAAGTPPLFYQWQLNGGLLQDQTNSTLTLSNAQSITGGSFSVTVFNQSEAITPEPAVLVVRAATEPPPTDQFNNRPRLQGFEGIMQGDSARAGSQPGEPVFPGGGKTVWCEWLAPADGILTLTAQGSGFDTLLGVFKGTALSNLTLITMDDDQGGFYSSRLQFNVQNATSYQIVLDGLGPGGGGGEFTVGWSLEDTKEVVPVIITNPTPQIVLPGSNAVFSVVTDSPSDMYQWFHNGVPIRGATGSVHMVNAQPADVGLYHVRVSNQWPRFTQSQPVSLELGVGSFTQPEYHKTEANGNRPGVGFFVSIFVGDTVWKQGVVPPPGPPPPCGTSWGPIAQGLHAEDTGFILVHTIGSAVAARISVYQDFHDFGELPIACGPEGNPSKVLFPVVQGSNYVVEIEGVVAGGNITFTNFLGIAPDVPEAPDYCLIPQGGSLLLTQPATNWVPVPTCQWRLNGQNIPGATNTTLLVTDFSLIQTGAYSVVMSNFVRTATNTVAYLDLAGPLVLGYTLTTNNGSVGFVIIASNAAPFLLVTKTDLDASIPWVPLFTNQESCLTFFFTNGNLLADPRRFFHAIPWPTSAP